MKEVRINSGAVELRQAENDGIPPRLVGYAAVFNREAVIGDFFRESVAPDAFDDVLSDDVRAVFNHDGNLLLGRVSSGTLRLSVDNFGLRYEIDMPDTSLGRDLTVLAERGDMRESSFAFILDGEGAEWDFSSEMPLRRITRFHKLIDVSPVTYPAYADTTVAIKRMRENKQELMEELNKQAQRRRALELLEI